MLRFHLRFTLFFTTLFVLFIISATMLGSTQPIHPALRGFFEGCENIPQPCWYGIVPGVTTREEAGRLLVSRGFRRAGDLRWVANDIDALVCEVRVSGGLDNILERVTLSFCGEVRIGDFLGLFGVYPAHAVECFSGIRIEQGYLGLDAEALVIRGRVFFLALRSYPVQYGLTSPWRGFAPMWRYRMLYGNYFNCGI